MNWRTILVLLTLLVSCHAMADTSIGVAPPDGHLCRRAIAAAERAHGIPSQLLASIARVESGRRDQASGTFNPWPWTINADGQGYFYETKAQAVAAALSERQHVAKSIDVGCMQISLTYHPDAFASLDMAFDPASNAEYGARFLMQLYEKTNSWPKAVGMYHSATPELGLDYQEKVYAVWPAEQKLAMAEPVMPEFSAAALTGHTNTLLPLHTSALPWVSPIGRGLLSTAFRPVSPRVILQGSDLSGGSAPGRTLDSYRSAPIRLAFRAP